MGKWLGFAVNVMAPLERCGGTAANVRMTCASSARNCWLALKVCSVSEQYINILLVDDLWLTGVLGSISSWINYTCNFSIHIFNLSIHFSSLSYFLCLTKSPFCYFDQHFRHMPRDEACEWWTRTTAEACHRHQKKNENAISLWHTSSWWIRLIFLCLFSIFVLHLSLFYTPCLFEVLPRALGKCNYWWKNFFHLRISVVLIMIGDVSGSWTDGSF